MNASAEQREFLPYGRQCIEPDDIAAVVAVLQSPWLTTGPKVAEFEAALANRLDVPHVSVCANGTAALHIAAIALGLGPGDIVIVPAVTFLATANAARYVGADVVFADVDPDNGLMMPENLTNVLAGLGRRRAKAIFPVHLNGQTGDPEGIQRTADEHGAVVVEDACHAIGTTYHDHEGQAHKVGACRHAAMAVFSFHPVKTITSGEGGAVTTRDPALQAKLERARNHGMVRGPAPKFEQINLALAADGSVNPWYYEMPEPGFNYRLTDVQCALGITQLAKLDRFLARRKALVARYNAALAPLVPLVRPIGRVDHSDPAWHLYAVLIDFAALKRDRAAIMNELRSKGIGSQVHYMPVHRQPYYRRRYGEQSLPGADAYYERVLSLPLFPAMSNSDVDYIAQSLAEIVGRS